MVTNIVYFLDYRTDLTSINVAYSIKQKTENREGLYSQ